MSAVNPMYINAAQQRILKMLQRLAGHEIEGIAPAELATALRTSKSNVTRDLANLAEAGLAESMEPTGRWRLTPRVVQISLAAANAFSRAEDRLTEARSRFTRNPH
ncbi:MAG TPA: helix-turn-helix domain-containing protein [Rhodanobacteraceae bacterium]|nr:helix-turn-helix domain-containing protein [Rhodanobacteraceae bacterium]